MQSQIVRIRIAQLREHIYSQCSLPVQVVEDQQISWVMNGSRHHGLSVQTCLRCAAQVVEGQRLQNQMLLSRIPQLAERTHWRYSLSLVVKRKLATERTYSRSSLP